MINIHTTDVTDAEAMRSVAQENQRDLDAARAVILRLTDFINVHGYAEQYAEWLEERDE